MPLNLVADKHFYKSTLDGKESKYILNQIKSLFSLKAQISKLKFKFLGM